ncbi:MAG: PilW family protein [Burkholderiaceae bacterium]|nr:PilW family protein [Burkholderiaceae bacterium]
MSQAQHTSLRGRVAAGAQPRQRGMTLVELMVGLVIGIVLSLAAASLYLATRETSRTSQSISDVNETGKIALEMIGREIQKAGFFPAQFGFDAATANQFAGAFENTKEAGNVVFNTGLFGCDGGNYNPATKACPPIPAASTPDSIVINYFSTPEFGAGSLMGNANDCNRRPVSGDPANNAAAAASQPLFVSNRFSIVDTASYVDNDKNTVTVNSLGCHGNGDELQAAAQPAIEGVEDMVIRYGIYGAGTDQSPTQFITAAQVNAAGTINTRTPWQRVTAVSVCIVVRSLANSRQEDKAGEARTYLNCRDAAPQPLPAGSRFIYKSFQRVYAVRNNLSGVL